MFCAYYHIKYLYNLLLVAFSDKMNRCNDCGTEINLTNREHGEIIECPECGIDLEIVNQNMQMPQIGLSEE